MKRFGLLAGVFLAAALWIPGCGDGGGGDEPTFFNDSLELRPDSRVVEADVRDDALISSDPEASEYVFDAAALDAAGVRIATGNVLLIAEEALIRVTSATPRGSEIVVNGDPATLPELVDGELSWNLGLETDDSSLPTLLIGGQEVEGVRKLDSIEYMTTVSGFKVSVSVTPTSSRNEVSFQMNIERGVASAVDFRAVATGKLSGFRHALDMAMSGGETERWNFSIRNLDAQMNVELAGSNAGTVELPLSALPSAFSLRIPIPTPIPLGLNFQISFALGAELQLPALVSAATQASADFRYGGTSGFQFDGASSRPIDSGGSGSVDTSGPNTTASSGTAGVILKFVPFFALNALLDQATAKLEVRSQIGASFEGDPFIGICSTTSASNIVRGVLTAQWFGLALGELDHEFFRKDSHLEHGQCRSE